MKNYLLSVCILFAFSLLGLTNVNAQFLEDPDKVDIVMIPGFDGDGSMAQYYLGQVSSSVQWTTETTDVAKWYKIPAGGVSDGTADVQAYYYKNVASGNYLYVSGEAQAELAAERSGDWPITEAEYAETNEKTDGFKWFDRTSPWPWGVYISNAAGIDLTQAEGNQFNVLTGIILMKINEGGVNGQEFFGVYEPNASVGGFKGGTGNAWTAVKTPVVVEAGVTNPDVSQFIDNPETVDIIQIPGFDGDGSLGQYYLGDLGADIDSIAWSLDKNSEVTQWYKIPAGGVSDSTTDVQAYYYKNVATGRYLYISDEILSQLAGDDGDWPTKRAQATAENTKAASFKWFDRTSPWPWGIYMANAAGINLSKREGNRYTSLTGIILMKINEGGINGEEFFGVYEPNGTVGGYAGGLGNAWTALKTPVVAVSGVPNPDFEGEVFAYSIDSLNFFATDDGENPDASSYNTSNHTITYKNGGWHRAGWNWEAEEGFNANAYNQVWIKFDASALPRTGDGDGGATKLQFDVVYMDNSTAAEFDNKTNEIRSNATEYFYNLTPGKMVKRITLKSEVEGDIVLTDAYFYKKTMDAADLIVTDITWTPANPVLGDSILLSATIKNQSEFASQDVKHGVVFSVMGTVIGWSDTHKTALAPGEEITVTANGGPNDGNGKWRPAIAKTFTVKAEVNDQHDVFESDYSNNSLEKDVVVGPSSVIDVTNNEKVYATDGKIHLVNFPANAVISIYNIQGQKIGVYSPAGLSTVTFKMDLYLLRSQEGENVSTFKVLVK